MLFLFEYGLGRGEGKDWVCGPRQDRAQNRPSCLCILVHRKKAWWKVRPLALGYISCKIAKSMRQNGPYDKKRKTRTPSQNIFYTYTQLHIFCQSPSLPCYTILYWLCIFIGFETVLIVFAIAFFNQPIKRTFNIWSLVWTVLMSSFSWQSHLIGLKQILYFERFNAPWQGQNAKIVSSHIENVMH